MKIIKKLKKIIYFLHYSRVLASYHFSSNINRPLLIEGHENIYIGKNVLIRDFAWLASMPLAETKEPVLFIDDFTVIGHYCHIYSTNSIYICRNVLIADKVYISDNIHDYKNTLLPIIKQPIVQKNKVIISEGAWIGENVCIIGASVGRNSVVGANSVVTKDVPDYCVVVGNPSRIIKKYDFTTMQWKKTNEKGEFI